MPDPGANQRAASRELAIAIALLLLVVAVYGPVRYLGWVNYDDPMYVTGNSHVTSGLTGDGIAWAFSSVEGSNWFPLTWLSLMTDCQIFGVHPGWLHLTNVALHAISTALLFGLLLRMTGATWPSALVAFLFALHPVHVESVAWISERKDVLCAVFWMLALWSYLSYVEKPGVRSYLQTLLLYALGFMAKPMVVTLPLVMLVLDFWPLQRKVAVGRLIREKLPFFALMVVMAVVTYLTQAHGGSVQSASQSPLGPRLQNSLISGAAYIVMMAWPTRLGVHYPMPLAGYAMWQVAGAALLLAAITLLAARTVTSRPYLAAGWCWYLITVAPVIGIVQVGDQARADRYLYLPSIGLTVMLAWSGADAWRRWRWARPVLATACAAACILCVVLTRRQLPFWESSLALWQHSIEVTGPNAVAHGSLGNAWRERREYDVAIGEYRQVLEINPREVGALLNMGRVLSTLGRSSEAIEALQEAVRIQPADPMLRLALGGELAKAGRWEDALPQMEAAVRLKPGYADAHVLLGTTQMNLGKLDDAIAQFSQALEINPESELASQSLHQAQVLKNRK